MANISGKLAEFISNKPCQNTTQKQKFYLKKGIKI